MIMSFTVELNHYYSYEVCFYRYSSRFVIFGSRPGPAHDAQDTMSNILFPGIISGMTRDTLAFIYSFVLKFKFNEWK